MINRILIAIPNISDEDFVRVQDILFQKNYYWKQFGFNAGGRVLISFPNEMKAGWKYERANLNAISIIVHFGMMEMSNAKLGQESEFDLDALGIRVVDYRDLFEDDSLIDNFRKITPVVFNAPAIKRYIDSETPSDTVLTNANSCISIDDLDEILYRTLFVASSFVVDEISVYLAFSLHDYYIVLNGAKEQYSDRMDAVKRFNELISPYLK